LHGFFLRWGDIVAMGWPRPAWSLGNSRAAGVASLPSAYRLLINADFRLISLDIRRMGLRFGDFDLDEETRSLTLRGEPVDIQPRVLELLAYLARNAGRVVPKSELMDALWPDLHVTEASLQRAVSLARRALKAGEMEGAIRNYIRLGYRFGVEPHVPGPAADERVGNHIAKARHAISERRWAEAARDFEAASGSSPLSADDLNLWAVALECQGRARDAIPVLTRAVEGYVVEGAAEKAAALAVALGKIHFEAKAVSAAHGWLDRARELTGASRCEAQAGLLWMQSRVAAFEGRPEDALELVADAFTIAEECDATGVKALTLSYLGFYNLSLGRVSEGAQQQDHAAAMALSGGVDPITGSLIYCNILWACRAAVDWSRAAQWNSGFETWCQSCYAELSGSCELHKADILARAGKLADALQRVEAAMSKLSGNEEWALGEAFRVRGDIHAMMGHRDLAREDHARAYSYGWNGEPGYALQLLEEGDQVGAIAALDSALADRGWFNLQRHGWLLANKAWVASKAGMRKRASDAIACFEEIAQYHEMPAAEALVAEARASLAAREGSHNEALRLLTAARQTWTGLRADFYSARARLSLAEQLYETGDLAGSRKEAQAAAMEAERCGAAELYRLAMARFQEA
jgi:DNA-binding winged helix-turn-helix (wHTH) protein